MALRRIIGASIAETSQLIAIIDEPGTTTFTIMEAAHAVGTCLPPGAAAQPDVSEDPIRDRVGRLLEGPTPTGGLGYLDEVSAAIDSINQIDLAHSVDIESERKESGCIDVHRPSCISPGRYRPPVARIDGAKTSAA